MRQQHWRVGRWAGTESLSHAEADPEVVRRRLREARRAAAERRRAKAAAR